MSEAVLQNQPPNELSPTSPAAALESDDELFARIRETLAESSQKEEQLFRGLIKLAKAWRLRPERFARLLKKAKMRPPRISEITVVFEHEKVRDAFLHGRSWKKSLQAARDLAPGALDRAGQRLADLLEKKARHWPEQSPWKDWLLTRGRQGQFVLESNQGTLTALPSRAIVAPVSQN